jgi:NTP pyrophosphatase (non-canonical NTP hydrolase)
MTDRVDKDSLPLNQPRRTPSHPEKSHIVKTKVDGKEKIIRFGEQGASTAGKPKEGESDRMKAKRASFKSRHAKNIAKGPSSPAYWANKVKWADGGFVKTNYYDGGSMRAQPQNAALGSIADFLKQTYSPRRTQQMQGTMEFLGVPALARTAERLSYGQPITNINKANVPMLPDDTAEAAMLVAPPLASLAKRVGTNLVQTAPAVARDIVQNVTSPLKSYAVKPKGGNWQPAAAKRDSVTMSVNPIKRNPDVISGDMINQAAGEDLWSKMVDMDVYQHPSSWLRENRPDVLNNLLGPEKGAVNKWLDTKLEKYIRNDMGTPDDPIRLAHEEGFSHIPGQAEELGMWLPEDVAAMRVKAGYPEEGFAVQRHAEAGYPEAMEINSRKAEMWEALSDAEITATPAREFQERFRMAREMPNFVSNGKQEIAVAERNPWIEKLNPETPIYKIDRPMDLNENLGFNHMADEIQNMLDPESGLPAALRLTPQQLDKISVKQMVEKVDAVNKWRSEEASKAELGDMMGNLTATARLEVPDAQLSFVKEPGMKWIDIPATTDASAMKLCTTIGRQAGWCTQGEGLAKRYGSGDNSLTTLIDAEGRPHAQAMLGKPNQSSYDAWFNKYKDTPEVDEFLNWEGQPKVTGSLDKRYQAWAKETGRPIEQVPQDIIELKPVENAFSSERAREYTKRDPDYKNKITDSVLDFLKSGSWGDVKDLHHYDIIDAKNPSAVKKFISENYGGDFGMVDANTIQKDFMKNYNGERFIKAEQFSDLVNDYVPRTDGYAEGGRVRAGEGLPDPTFSNLRVYADTVSQEMFPSERDQTKRDAARHMIASAIAAQKTNPTIAGLLGKAYEFKEAPFRTAGHWMGLSEPRSDYPTDVHNNELGIQLNKDARSLQELLDSVEREVKRGTSETQKGRASLKPDVVKFTRYAEGGSVAYDPFQVDEIMNSINAPRNYAQGGSVSAYDPSRVDAIVNQFM